MKDPVLEITTMESALLHLQASASLPMERRGLIGLSIRLLVLDIAQKMGIPEVQKMLLRPPRDRPITRQLIANEPTSVFPWETSTSGEWSLAKFPWREQDLQRTQGILSPLSMALLRSRGDVLGFAGVLGDIYQAVLSAEGIEKRAEHQIRRSQGRYYTPPKLIQSVLEGALDPHLQTSSPSESLRALRLCDPSCGSGHFLLSAARRLSEALQKRLSPVLQISQHEEILQDVIANCIYGVDIDPMSVELSRCALWLEAGGGAAVLKGLRRHILQGNSLLGATPQQLAEGIPQATFHLREGDDRELLLETRRRNRRERKALVPLPPLSQLKIQGLDAWCSAFFETRVEENAPFCTENSWRMLAIEEESERYQSLLERAEDHAKNLQFFHWHWRFPEIFFATNSADECNNWEGGRTSKDGFDVIIGNPPFANAIGHPRTRTMQSFIRRRFPELRGAADLAFFFLALGRELQSTDGHVGFVLPRILLNAPSALQLRAVCSPCIIDVPDSSFLFEDADIFVCLVVLGPERGLCKIRYQERSETWREVELKNPNWWSILSLGEHAQRLEGPQLDAHFDVSGSMTVGDAYLIRPFIDDDPNGEELRLITTGLIDPQISFWGENKCRYLKRKIMHPRLRADPSFQRSLLRRLEQGRRPKVLVAGLSRKIECFVDVKGECIGAVSTFTILHPEDDVEALSALCVWLLSEEIHEVFMQELGGHALSGGNITMRKSFLAALPLSFLKNS